MHHQIVWIDSGGQRAVYAADLIPTTAHVPDAWIVGFDLFPMDTMDAKKAFIREVLGTETLVVFEHDPVIAAGRIAEAQGKRRVVSAAP
jgi:glyoxylase-like metal-dependent hydrolase (beta-lactamase superfamily II)